MKVKRILCSSLLFPNSICTQQNCSFTRVSISSALKLVWVSSYLFCSVPLSPQLFCYFSRFAVAGDYGCFFGPAFHCCSIISSSPGHYLKSSGGILLLSMQCGCMFHIWSSHFFCLSLRLSGGCTERDIVEGCPWLRLESEGCC